MQGELIKGYKSSKYMGLFTLTVAFEKVIKDGDEILKKTHALGDWVDLKQQKSKESISTFLWSIK